MRYPFPDQDKSLHILVVDDLEFDRMMICERLKEVVPPGSKVSAIENGMQALETLRQAQEPYDCVLLDMNLPDVHGIELTRQLQHVCPGVGIVVITVESDMEKALLCLQAGAEDFLVKGEYSNIGLYRAIRFAMERRQHRMVTAKLEREQQHDRELIAMQKEFIHLISQEFQTPITIISGAMQLLGLKAPDIRDGVGAKQFTKVDRALVKLIGLLDNVQHLNALEEGNLSFNPELFDMQVLVAQVIENLDSQRIQRTGELHSIHYYGDRQLVAYALSNVLGNALKYSPEESPVVLSLELLPRGISLLIKDEGAGMSSEVMVRVGERAYRRQEATSTEGTGLGIYLARRFIEHHGGSLILCSSPNEGTTVSLFLPHQAGMPVI